MKSRRLVRRLLIPAAVSLVFLAGELTARAWAQVNHIPASYPPQTERLPAYEYAPYWSPAFIAAASVIQEVIIEDKHGLLTTPDVVNPWFNVRDGFRVTIGQPDTGHILYLFGASEVFGMGVPDEQTIPSRLQAMLPAYRVKNYGRIGYTTTQQLLLLRTVELKPGDIVIWLDGTMDATRTYDYARRRASGACEFLQNNIHHLMLVRLAVAPCLSAHATDGDLIRAAVDDYRDNVQQAAVYVRRAGAMFIHFLEPMIFSAPLSDADRTGRAGAYISDSPGLEDTYRLIWPAFQSIAECDLTHSLDALRGQRTIYIDSAHYNHEATEAVAKAILDQLSIF